MMGNCEEPFDMITIHLYGLDHFVVGQYSREHTGNIAQLFETPEEEVSFLSSDSVYLHDGVEQVSWNALVVVHAPEKYEPFEKIVADYFLKTLSPFAIHVSVQFEYFHNHSIYESVNPNYPRFITADQIHDVTIEEDEGEEECQCGHHHEGEETLSESEEEVYTGNAFEGFEERLAKASGEEK